MARKRVKRRKRIKRKRRLEETVILSHLTLLFLVILFSILAFVLYFSLIPSDAIYLLLVFCAFVWLLAEMKLRRNWRMLKKAFLVGLFLLVFDFLVQNGGWLTGLWETHRSAFTIGIVPIEIMALCLIGGTAWALYLPAKYDRLHTFMDILVFAVYGAFGEYLLRVHGLMSYYGWWNAGWAFLSYAITWVILHYLRYKVVRVQD